MTIQHWLAPFLLTLCLLFPAIAEEAPGIRFQASKLAEIDKEIASGQWGPVDSFVVVHRGELIAHRRYPRDYSSLVSGPGPKGPYNYQDPDWYPFQQGSDLHTVQSVTKSVMATLVAIALERGELKSLDQEVAPLLDFPVPPDLTVRHLLDMTAGMQWDEESDYGDPGNDWSNMEQSEDWLAYVRQKPMLHKPGRTFTYNSGLPQLLTLVLETTTGEPLETQAEKRLFKPLGISRWYWKRSPSGEIDAQGGLYLSALSLAKLGQLHLQDGVYSGRRLLPKGWLEQISGSGLRAYEGLNYSLGWWLPTAESISGSVMAIGYGGQRLVIVPEQEMVLVFLAWNLVSEKPAPSTQQIVERFLGCLQQ